MTDIVEQLVEDLAQRLTTIHSKQEHLKYLMGANAYDLIETSYLHVLHGIQRDASMVEILANVGHRIRYKMGESRDSLLAAHLGAFVLDSYINVGIFKVGQKRPMKKGKKSKWAHSWLHVSNWTSVDELWSLIDPDEKGESILPMVDTPPLWTSGYHDTGISLIKHGSKYLLDGINKHEHGFIFDVLNKLQARPWSINRDVYSVFISCLDKDSRAFNYTRETDLEKRRSMMFETTAIRRIATKFLGQTLLSYL